MKEPYNRLSVGEKLRTRRISLGFTQDEVAEKIGRAPKYYADIERGSCGMSLETLISISKIYNLSLDYLLLDQSSISSSNNLSDEIKSILEVLNSLPKDKHDYALRLLKLFLSACDTLQ